MVACATSLGRAIETCTRGEACRCVFKMRQLLKVIAYPRRGTEDERLNIYRAAELIQKEFTSEQLGDVS